MQACWLSARRMKWQVLCRVLSPHKMQQLYLERSHVVNFGVNNLSQPASPELISGHQEQ